MSKTYRVKVEILHTKWKVGDTLTEKDLEGYDIFWMLYGSQCIEEVAAVQVFQAVPTGAGTEGGNGGSENVVPSADNPPAPAAPVAKPTVSKK
ncbi:MAG: hypothetical protein N2112_02495 [Gemmataceae bacterium]|nr:hypothetical protein [Gemmataceae bacterium]